MMFQPTQQQRDDLKAARELVGRMPLDFTQTYNVEHAATEIASRLPGDSEVEPIARLLPACGMDERELLIKAPQYMRLFNLFLTEAFARIKDLESRYEPKRKAPSLAQQCAIECAKPAFKKFLHEQHEVDIADQERVNTRVRTMLKIQSRAELDTDSDAARRWRDLHDRFKKWMNS